MKKNGFTLVELLAVIVILAIVTTMASIGGSSLRKGINKSMWNSTVELIENGAKNYCSDKKTQIKNLDTSKNKCTVNGKNYNPCLTIKVEDLLERKYINTKNYAIRNKEKIKVLVNNTVTKSDNETENFKNGYYVNDGKVYIYLENDLCYAKYIGL